MIILDTLIIGGLRFVLGKIAQAVDAELNDESVLREELLAAQMRLELGELSLDDFAALERDLLARMREIRERAGRGPSGPMRITGVDVRVADGVDDDAGPDRPPRR
jgi:hypothetical protein